MQSGAQSKGMEGTNGLYPFARGARSPNEDSRLPLWNPLLKEVRTQQATMFDTADCLPPSGAFYVAVDVCTKNNGKDLGLG